MNQLIHIERATLDRVHQAYAIVQEYYEAVGVLVREDAEHFTREYFGETAGLWLALDGTAIIGCIALRSLPQLPHSGEIKRMYVKPGSRGHGIAEQLLKALESYAAAFGYRTLYLDSSGQ